MYGMQDVRLSELEFLSDLENAPVKVCLIHRNSRYSLPWTRFNELVMHLVSEGCVTSHPLDNESPSEVRGYLASSTPLDNFVGIRQMMTAAELLNSREVRLLSTFKGRLRLWTLRDQLRSHRQREPFGIVWSMEYFERDWVSAWAFATPGFPISLLYCDLDNFKPVNDTYDHEVGDKALKLYLQTIRDAIGDKGDAYRGVGDEVVVMVPAIDKDSAAQLATAICSGVRSTMKTLGLNKLDKPLTVSIGAKTYTAKVDAAEARTEVDRLMLRSKKAGKNQCTVG